MNLLLEKKRNQNFGFKISYLTWKKSSKFRQFNSIRAASNSKYSGKGQIWYPNPNSSIFNRHGLFKIQNHSKFNFLQLLLGSLHRKNYFLAPFYGQPTYLILILGIGRGVKSDQQWKSNFRHPKGVQKVIFSTVTWK